MPNLRSKTWTTTTPANVEDAQYWEDHLISDADAAKIATSVQSVNNTTPDAQGNVDIVALPSGGTAGQVLTKQSSTEGDADWEDPASSGHTIEDEDGTTMTQQDTLQFVNADVTNDSVNGKTVVDCKGSKGDAATVTVGTTTTLSAGSDATVTNSGTTSAAVFNFGIPKGADGADGSDGADGADGISVTGVELLSTSGKVKTYRMSFSDGNHFDYNVTDGADGTGAGDMLSSDYDADSTVYNAGGITSYVASQAYSLPTAASNVLGGVKVGTNLSINASGVLSATDTNTDALHDLTDVNISLPSDGQALLYDSVSSKWVNGDVAGSAADITYDNTTSGLTADDVQEALDEIDGNVDTLSGKVYKTDDSTETAIASDDLLPIYDTSATASKKITVANVVKATVSNPNLLDNPFFTINQRGAVTYSGSTYCVDRWRSWETGDNVVNSDGVLVEKQIAQVIDNSVVEKILDRDVTISMLYDNGKILSTTGKIHADLTSTVDIAIEEGGVINFIVYDFVDSGTGTHVYSLQANVLGNTPVQIRAIKLELGSVSTLAMDTAPNYATELLKCQRYFQKCNDTYMGTLAYGQFDTSIRNFVPMRTTPTLVLDNIQILNGSTWENITDTSKYAVTVLNNENVRFATFNVAANTLVRTSYSLSADL